MMLACVTATLSKGKNRRGPSLRFFLSERAALTQANIIFGISKKMLGTH